MVKKEKVSIIIWILVIIAIIYVLSYSFLTYLSSNKIYEAEGLINVTMEFMDLTLQGVQNGAFTPEEGLDMYDEDEKVIDEAEQLVISAEKLIFHKSTNYIRARIEIARDNIELRRYLIAQRIIEGR